MEKLDTNFQQLTLDNNPANFGDANCNPPPSQYGRGFGHFPEGRNMQRFNRYPTKQDIHMNAVNGYQYLNPWCVVNKSENIGLFGAPPNPQDTACRMDNFNLGGQRNFNRQYRNGNNNNNNVNYSNGNNTHHSTIWKSNFKTDDELFNEPKTEINMQPYENIPVKQSGPDWTAIDPLTSFNDLDLNKIVRDNIERVQYLHPTPVQKYALPIVLAKRDLMACAQTGSGKTAAFLLPIIHMMLESENCAEVDDNTGIASPVCLILAPTRELSCQIFDEARRFSFHSNIKTCVVYGGAPLCNQMRDLSKGCELLVATPGRLADMINRQKVTLEKVKFLVLDEADRMLDMGFEPQIRKIVEQNEMPSSDERQTLMFSATFPTEIQTLAKDFLNNYIFLAVGRVGSTSENISQKIFYIPDKDKPDLLVRILKEKDPMSLVLVFVETKKGADLLSQYLSRLQFSVSSIHGDRPQADRERALSSFRSGRTPVMIATAVAARGLDIPNVKHVINFDLPSDIEEYVHRIGRTGRMGQPGSATSFFCDRNQNVARHLVDLLRESKQPVPDWLDQRASTNATNGMSGRRFAGGQNRRSGCRPNYASLDFRTGQNTNTSYVPNPQNLGLLGNGATPLAYMGPNLRYQQNTNPFAAAVAALGLQNPFCRGIFDTHYQNPTFAYSGPRVNNAGAGGQHHVNMSAAPLSLIQGTSMASMMHGQPATDQQMHQFFASAAAAGMRACTSTSNTSPSISEYTLSNNGNYQLQQNVGHAANFTNGYTTFHPNSALMNNPSCSTPSSAQPQDQTIMQNRSAQMFTSSTKSLPNSANSPCINVGSVISPSQNQTQPTMFPQNVMPYYGHQSGHPQQIYSATPQGQQQQQQAAIAAAMALAAAMHGTSGQPMDPCVMGPHVDNSQQSVGQSADSKTMILATSVNSRAPEWWNPNPHRPAN